MLREVMVNIGLERIDIQKGIIVEALLDNGATGLVMSLEFAEKQGFKLKKIERPIYVRNIDGTLNKEGPIENTVEINIYYQEHRERTEINMIGEQKQNVILEMPQLACHNPEIDWRIEEVKITRCSEECGKQWRLKQGKPEWQKQREEEKKEEAEKKREEKVEKKQKKTKTMDVKRVAEEWEIWKTILLNGILNSFQPFFSWLMYVYYYNTSINTSRSQFSLLYSSQINLFMISSKYSNLLFFLTYLITS